MQVYVSLKYCRVLRYCITGVKRFCVRNDLDFKKLSHVEMPVEEFEATGEAMALEVVKLARRVADGR